MRYDTLKINATIERCYVKVKFSDWGCSDTGPDPQTQGYHNTEGKKKDVECSKRNIDI